MLKPSLNLLYIAANCHFEIRNIFGELGKNPSPRWDWNSNILRKWKKMWWLTGQNVSALIPQPINFNYSSFFNCEALPSPDLSVLLLLNFDIISRKCKIVKKVAQCTSFLTNDALTWKNRLLITSRKGGLTHHIFDSWATITLDSDCLH